MPEQKKVDLTKLLTESSQKVQELLSIWSRKEVAVEHKRTEFIDSKLLDQTLMNLDWDVAGFATIRNKKYKGLIIQLMKKEAALGIVGFAGGDPNVGLCEKNISALKETLNVVSGGYINKFVELFDLQLELDPPIWIPDKSTQLIKNELIRIGDEDTTIILIESVYDFKEDKVVMPVVIVLNNIFVSLISKGE